MYPDWTGLIVSGFFAGWLFVISYLIWQQSKFLNLLFPKSGERDIRKKFEEIAKLVESFDGKLNKVDSKVELIEKQGLQHIQKVEILRFNPYNDTGGDQSFTVCLLDNQGSGVVVTSLHARSGTRVFGKEINQGKSTKYQLSKEEELVVEKAMGR